MAQQPASQGEIGIAPLIGNRETVESHWIGALLSSLLTEHLQQVDLSVVDYNAVARAITASKLRLPLDDEGIQVLRRNLKIQALVHGRYVLDDEAKMLGLRLFVIAPDVPAAPLEISFPLPAFNRAVAQVVLAIIERLGISVDDPLRQRVNATPRPTSFEAFRQVAQARAAWARNQNELALAAASSALTLDPDYEDAAAVQTAVARTANDTETTLAAFRRWSAIAGKRGRPITAAERLMLLGHWLRDRGEWPEARRAYEDARNVFEREKHDVDAASALNNIANLELLSGRVQNAIKTYRRSLRTFEAAPEAQPDTVIALFNLSLAHKMLGQRDEALQAIEEALAGALQLKSTALQARCLAQRGAIRDDLGEWSRAQADYVQAAQLLRAAGDEAGLAMVKCHQAILYKQQGTYDRAESLFVEALDTFDREGDPHERAVVCLNLGNLYYAMGLTEQAWTYAEQAEESFTRLKSGRLDQVKELIAALEAIPEPPAEEPPSTPLDDTAPLAGPLFATAQGNPPDGLYSGGNLYDNGSEASNRPTEDGNGGDVDENSSVGRTPMM